MWTDNSDKHSGGLESGSLLRNFDHGDINISQELEPAGDSDAQCLKPEKKRPYSCAVFCNFILALLLVGSNIGWWFAFSTADSTMMSENYYGATDIQTTFHHDWMGLQPGEDESRYADKKWEDLFPALSGRVALSQDLVTMLSLPKSAPADDDSGKSVYMIAGYHQLHCLAQIRKVLHKIQEHRESVDEFVGGSNWDHVLHCVEAVRQGLMCKFDDTLLVVKETWPPIGDGSAQVRTCTNVSAVYAWAERYPGREKAAWTLPSTGS